MEKYIVLLYYSLLYSSTANKKTYYLYLCKKKNIHTYIITIVKNIFLIHILQKQNIIYIELLECFKKAFKR